MTIAKLARPTMVLLVLPLGLSLAAPKPARCAVALDAQSTDAGKTSGQLGVDFLQKDFKINVSSPMQSPDATMTTVDGTTETFKGSLNAPASKRALHGIIQWDGATKDITNLTFSQDLDLDGTFDYQFTIPGAGGSRISGICADGYVSCDAGTWNNCQYYYWKANAAGELQVELSSIRREQQLDDPNDYVTACYCINSSCGSPLMNNIGGNVGVVLEDLGTGAMAAILLSKTSWSLANVDNSPPEILFYAQDFGAEMTDQSGNLISSDVPQKDYYRNPSGMQGDGEDAALVADADPSSNYKLLQGLATASSGDVVTKACAINRTIDIEALSPTEIVNVTTNANCGVTVNPVGPAGTPSVTVTFTGVHGNNCNWNVYSCNVNFRPEMILAATAISAWHEDEAVIGYNGIPIFWGSYPGWTYTTIGNPAECHNNDQDGTTNLNLDLTNVFTGTAGGQFQLACTGEDGNGGSSNCGGNLRFDINDGCNQLDDDIDDGCAIIDADPECHLQTERVDNVITMNAEIPTGFVPNPSTRLLTAPSGTCGRSVTRDWWRKDRTYLCRGVGTYDFDDTLERAQTVTSSVTSQDQATADTFTYDDKWMTDPSSGVWDGTATQPIDPLAAIPVAPCQKACKTVSDYETTDVNTDGSRSEELVNPQQKVFNYYQCTENDTCPHPNNETVLKACQCLDEFAEAASIMKSFEVAAKDMICSTGNKVVSETSIVK